MATPKTPRKRAVKAASVEDIGAVDSVADTVDETGVTLDETKVNPDGPAVIAEDPVVILDEPDTPESLPVTEAEPAPHILPEIAKPAHQPTPPTPKSSPGFVPLVLGGVVAAGIGFGLARYVVPEGWPVPGSSPFQAQLAQQATEIQDLRTQLQAVPKDNPALISEVEQLRATATTALETAEAAKRAAASPADNSEALAELAARLTALEARPEDGAAADPATIAALKADVATLRSGLAEQKAISDTFVQAEKTAREEVTAQAQSILLQAALIKIEAAMQNGLPFTEPLALLADAGVSIPQNLTNIAESGLPTLADLSSRFDEPARVALNNSLRADMGENWSDRVGRFLRTQTGARSLTPQEGNDPDAILSRADAAVTAGDLETALDEIATLPEAAQSALADWVAQVKLRLDAQAATAELSAALSER